MGFESTYLSYAQLLLSNGTFNNPFSQFTYAPNTLHHGFSSVLQPVHGVYSPDAPALAAIAYDGFQVQNSKCGPGQAPYPQTCRHREAGTPAETTADMVYTSHQFDLEVIPAYGHQVTAYASDQATRKAADMVLLPDHVTSTLREKDLRCSICNKVFARKSARKSHEKIHKRSDSKFHSKATLACNFCYKRRRKCSGETPQCQACRDDNRQCTYPKINLTCNLSGCVRTFKRQGHLDKHIKDV